MKISILCIVPVLLLMSLTSCEIETSENGDLDGYWHLEQVDTLATGGVCIIEINVYFGEFSTN